MNGLTILLWITIVIIGAIAIIAVKLHYKGDELEKDNKPILSKDNFGGILSYGQNKEENNTPEKQFTQPTFENDVYPNEEALEYEYDAYIEPQVEDDTYKNITYESENQVLINYGNEVEKTQEPMTEMQVEIMTQDNEKHELKDLFTIDELIKESKRKDSEREKEAQQISKEDDAELNELKESIRQKKENEDAEDKLIEEILADEEISELLASDETEEPTIEEIIEEPAEPTIQQIIEEKPAEETVEEAEPTIQEIIEEEPAEEAEPAEPTIQQIIEEEPAEETVEEAEPVEPTIQQIIEEEPAEETAAEVPDVAEEKEETPSVASQKDIAEAIDNASQEIEEKEVETISDGENITDVLLSSEEEIKEPALKTPTKIGETSDDDLSSSTDSGSQFETKEENDLDYRKDLAKITNTIKGSKLFQDVKDRIRGEPAPEVDPLADIQQDYIRNVNEFEDEYDEYAPIINETHDEFGEVYEPDYDQAIREENTRRLMSNDVKPAAPEPVIAEPKVGTIKPKPSRDSIKIKLGNADLVVKKGDEIIFKHDGETYSSQVYAINGDDISVRYRRKDITIKPEDVKKVY